MARTLNTKYPQVIIYFPDDENGFTWHHRVLLKKVSPGVWLCLTPDHGVTRHDLNELTHKVLARNAEFPASQAPFVYAHDPISTAQLKNFEKVAATSVAILGDGADASVDEFVWVNSEVE